MHSLIVTALASETAFENRKAQGVLLRDYPNVPAPAPLAHASVPVPVPYLVP